MAVSVEQVAKRCGATLPRDEEEVQRVFAYASTVVTEAFNNAWRTVPDEVWDECVLRVAYSVYKRAKALDSGNMLSADGTGVPGVANDPLRTSWPLIKRYINRV